MNRDITVGLVFYKESKEVISLIHFFLQAEFNKNIFEILIVANSAQDQALFEVQNAISNLGRRVHLFIQSENNLASARQLILDQSHSQWIYFTDPDCQPQIDKLNFLFQSKNEKYFAISGPNRPNSLQHPFYSSLNLLSQTWLGNFGSSQFKTWNTPQELCHAPTCNILYNRKHIRFAFDSALSEAGEDLDFNLRHCHSKFNLILHLPQAEIVHNHPTTHYGWAKKVFKWGKAQPKVILRRNYWRQGLRLLPLAGVFFSSIIFIFAPLAWTQLLTLYIILTFTHSILVCFELAALHRSNYTIEKVFKALGSHLILTWTTHLAYAIGQVAGCWHLLRDRRLAKQRSQKSQRTQ